MEDRDEDFGDLQNMEREAFIKGMMWGAVLTVLLLTVLRYVVVWFTGVNM